MANRLILAVLVSVLLSGCAPVLSNQITREADGKIAFPDLMTQPDRFRGAVVILGGQIIETVAKENETLVQVLQLPWVTGSSRITGRRPRAASSWCTHALPIPSSMKRAGKSRWAVSSRGAG